MVQIVYRMGGGNTEWIVLSQNCFKVLLSKSSAKTRDSYVASRLGT